MYCEFQKVGIKASTIALLIALLFPSFLVSASPTSKTVSLSTGDRELFSGVKVRLTCNLNVQLSPTSYTIEPGKSTTWYIQINSPGTVSLSVFIPSPYNNWYTVSEDFSTIKRTLYIPITSGLSATLEISPSASLSVNGPGSLSVTSMSFDYMGSSKSFTVSSYTSASNRAKITVSADFKLGISVGLSISLLLFNQQITRTSIGQFSMSPSVSDSITVSKPYFNPIANLLANPLFMIIGFISLLGLIVGVAIHTSAKKAEMKRKKRVLPPPPITSVGKKQLTPARPQEKAIYCIYCGEKLPLDAVYCRKCGKKVK